MQDRNTAVRAFCHRKIFLVRNSWWKFHIERRICRKDELFGIPLRFWLPAWLLKFTRKGEGHLLQDCFSSITERLKIIPAIDLLLFPRKAFGCSSQPSPCPGVKQRLSLTWSWLSLLRLSGINPACCFHSFGKGTAASLSSEDSALHLNKTASFLHNQKKLLFSSHQIFMVI